MKLEEIYGPLGGDLDLVEDRLRSAMRKVESEATGAIETIMNAGGKRLRPALLLFAARGCDYTGERAIALGAAVELIHTASLIHDDVVDGADVRRGVPTANSSLDNKRSVLLGDCVYTIAVEMVAADGDLDIIRSMASTAAKMARGEMIQTLCRNGAGVSEKDYLDIIATKTAALISCCCRVGALLGESRNGEVESLSEYGRNLGMAFQITDDLLDFAGDERLMGKALGNDIREGRLTLPFIRAMAEADPRDSEWMKGVFRSGRLDADIMGRMSQLVDRCSGVEYSRRRALEYTQACQRSLESLKESEVRRSLSLLADYVVSRAS